MRRMKNYNSLMIFTLLLSLSLYGQQNKPNIFFQKLNNLFPSRDALNSIELSEIPVEELDSMITLLYDGYADNPISFLNTYKSNHENFNNAAKNDRNLAETDVKPAIKIKKLQELIASKRGEAFALYIKIPFFFKGTLTSINRNELTLPDGRKIFGNKVSLTFLVSNVLKGSHIIKEGNEIIVEYSPYWLEDGYNLEPIIGKEYFVPASVLSDYDDYSVLSLYNYKPPYITEIEQGQITSIWLDDKTVTILSWEEFADEFRRKYIIEKEENSIK